MALKPCKECKTKVSNKAKVCPNCGISKPVKSGTSFIWLILLILVLFTLLSPESETTQQSTKAIPSTNNAEKQLAAAMKDPRKVRLMECIGVNPWKEKPSRWEPPTETECNQLKQVLDAESKQRNKQK